MSRISLGTQGLDRESLVLGGEDEAFPLQAQQGFPHRGPAHPDPRGQVRIADALPGAQVTLQDQVLQLPVHVVPQGFAGYGHRSI